MADQNPPANGFHLRKYYKEIMQKNALLYKYQFTVEFIGLSNVEIPEPLKEGNNNAAQTLTYYVKSANIPGYELTNATPTFLGTQFRVPGVLKFGHSWAVKILLDQSLYGYQALQTWRRQISRLGIDGGGNKVIPKVQAKINILSTDHQFVTKTYVLEGVWIAKLGKLDLKYATNGGENPLELDAEFKYQYVYPAENVEKPTDSDPLKA